MRFQTRQLISKFAIASVILKFALGIFMSLVPIATDASASASDRSLANFVVVICTSHGKMRIPAADLGVAGPDDIPDQDTGNSNTCECCIRDVTSLPSQKLTLAFIISPSIIIDELAPREQPPGLPQRDWQEIPQARAPPPLVCITTSLSKLRDHDRSKSGD